MADKKETESEKEQKSSRSFFDDGLVESIKVDMDSTWYVMADEIKSSIIIPIETLEHLSSEEIGDRVNRLFTPAAINQLRFDAIKYRVKYRKCRPKDVEQAVTDYLGLAQRGDKIPGVEVDELAAVRRLFLLIKQQAVAKLVKSREKLARKLVAGKSYSSIFLKVAKRDGFQCKTCEKPASDLTLSTTDDKPGDLKTLENLFITCGNCAWEKDVCNKLKLETRGLSGQSQAVGA